jgi:hypothetical protein
MGRSNKSKRARIPAGPKKLPEPLREFLDNCVIPALVEKFLAKHKEGR